jgi:hypothetical protein
MGRMDGSKLLRLRWYEPSKTHSLTTHAVYYRTVDVVVSDHWRASQYWSIGYAD